MSSAILLRVSGRIDRIFVYGTLRRGRTLHRSLKAAGLRYAGTGSIRARLYDLGPYPGAVPSTSRNDVVRGEVYLATRPDEQISRIDAIEDFDPVQPGRSLFLRRRASVRLSNGRRVRAWVYFLPRKPSENRRIVSGNYGPYRRARKSA